MIKIPFEKFKKLRKSKRFLALSAGGVAVLVLALCLVFGGSKHSSDATATTAKAVTGAHLTANTSDGADAASSGATATASNNKGAAVASASTTAASVPTTTTVVKTTTNSDGTTTKQIVVAQSIPFSSQTQNDSNLKRGTTQVQTGQAGVETITYSVTYDKSGQEISRKTISDTITKQPVAQITRVGTSDFNLNTDTWDSFEFGEACSPADYTAGTDGCVGVPSNLHFAAVQISGVYYVSCISSANGVCAQNATVNIHPVIAIQGDNFSYQGTTYRADPRAGAGMSGLLTSADCTQYGLACGSW